MKPVQHISIIVLAMLICLPAQGAGILDRLKKAVSGENTYTVRGRVLLKDGQTLTCFAGIQSGYLGAPNLAAPGGATQDPNTGRITASTAAIPAVVMTQNGTVIPNNCDGLERAGVLVPPDPADVAAAAAKLPPKTPCRDVPADLQAAYAKTCVSFDPADHCSALPIDGTWKNGQTDLAAVCDSRHVNAVIEEEQRYQASKKAGGANAAGGVDASAGSAAKIDAIQKDSSAKFAAIQKQASAPAASAAAQSDEDLAWDGAKLCGLKPARTLKLKDESLQFVRFDKKADRVIMSEFANGARKDVALDEKGFAQKSQVLSRDLSAGGDTCARAFWGNEAIKSASAALDQ